MAVLKSPKKVGKKNKWVTVYNIKKKKSIKKLTFSKTRKNFKNNLYVGKKYNLIDTKLQKWLIYSNKCYL